MRAPCSPLPTAAPGRGCGEQQLCAQQTQNVNELGMHLQEAAFVLLPIMRCAFMQGLCLAVAMPEMVPVTAAWGSKL